MHATLRSLAILLAANPLALATAQDPPVCKDATGIRWVLPFARAKADAVARNRMLMIKPIAFGTTADGGW